MRRYLQFVLLFCGTFTLVAQAQSSICDTSGLDVPQVECQALMSIYANTGGVNWTYGTDWGSSTTICAWEGVTCSGGHVTELNMWGSNIQGDFAITQGNLDFLEYLYLYSNQITGFSTAGLSRLIILDLGWNQLVSFDGAGLTNLQTLYLNDNDLTLFNGVGLSNLINLYLYDSSSYDSSDNKLSSVDGSLFPNLQTLDIGGNQLTSFNGSQFSNLVSLDIGDNKLTSFSGAGLGNLSTLDATNNQLGSITNQDQLINVWYVSISNNKLTSPTPAVSAWLDQYAESNWSQTQTTTTVPSGSTGGTTSSPDTTASSTTDPSGDSNPSSDTNPPSVSGGTSDTNPSSSSNQCGNSVVDIGEACEASINPVCENGYPCSGCQCIPPTIPPSSSNECGNGVVDIGEACEASINPVCENGYPCSGCQCIPPTIVPTTTEKAECGQEKKDDCKVGSPENQDVDNTFANLADNPERRYIWDCVVDANNKDEGCYIIVPLCKGQEYDPKTQACCAGTVINTQTQKCCQYDSNGDNPGANAHDGVFGPEEVVCPKENKCVVRTVCSDGFEEMHGEDGGADVSCMAQVSCISPTAHVSNVCDSNRPNNNCQDECETGVLPPNQCPWGGVQINGVCGIPPQYCSSGVKFGNNFFWWCLGSDNTTALDDKSCSLANASQCGTQFKTCNPGTPKEIIGNSTNWWCMGTDTTSNLDDILCTIDPIPGVCGEIYLSCAQGTQEIIVGDSGHWWCRGKNGGADDYCSVRNGICGTDKFACNYSSLPLGIPLIIPPGYTGTTFQWVCPGQVGGIDAECAFTCPAGQVIDPLLKECIIPPPDLCNNIAGIQNPLPSNTNRDPVSGNCCTNPTIWNATINGCLNPIAVTCSASPLSASINQQVTWAANVSGSTGSYAYSWTGTNISTPLTVNPITKTYTTAGQKITTVTVTSGGWSQSAVCSIMIGAPSAPTGLSAVPSTCGNYWVNVSWNASPGATKYRVYREYNQFYTGYQAYPATANPDGGPDTAFSDKGENTGVPKPYPWGLFGPGDMPAYIVQAGNSVGWSPQSTWVRGMVNGPCSTGTISATNCTIPAGQSTCNTTLSWNLTSPYWYNDASGNHITPYSTTTVSTSAATIATAHSNTGTLRSLPYGSQTFYLKNTTQDIALTTPTTRELATATATAACIAGTTWNGTVCAATLPNLTTGAVSPATTNTTVNAMQIFTATISNANASTGAGFNNFFQVATDINDPIQIGDKTPTTGSNMGIIGAGASANTTLHYIFTIAGTYYIRACADKTDRNSAGVIVESNESDNCSAAWTTVTVLPLPPATPTGLSATPSICGNNWLNLSWNASAGATNYKVYRGATKIYDGPNLTYSDTGLTLGATYTYTIEASNTGGTSARSAPAISGTVNTVCPDLTSTITSPTTATLNIPLNFTATIASANAGTGVGFNTLFQVATQPNGGGDVSTISVNSRAALAANTSGSVASSNYTFTATGEYSVRACADNNASFIGVITESSEINNCSPTWTTVKVPPATPTGFWAGPSTCGTGQINLSWNASLGATNYKVYRGATKVYDGPLLAYSDTGLTAGTAYTYTIVASNIAGDSAPGSTTPVLTTVPLACIAPTITTQDATAITANTATIGATVTGLGTPAATIRGTCYGTTAASTSNCIVAIGMNTLPFTRNLTGLTAGTTYYFRGYAINTNGIFYSADKTFVTTPPTPTGFWAGPHTCGTGQINLSWNVTAGATSYKIYRDGILLALPAPDCITTPGSCKVSNTGLTAGTNYTYTIKASNAAGDSAPGSTTPVLTTAPLACAALPDLTAGAPFYTGTALVNTPITFSAPITSDSPINSIFNNIFQISSKENMDIIANQDGIITPSTPGSQVGPLTIGALTGTTAGVLTFPEAKTYYVRACADNDINWLKSIPELNDNNNCGPETEVIVKNVYSVTYHSNDSNNGTYNDTDFVEGTNVTVRGKELFTQTNQEITHWCLNTDCSGPGVFYQFGHLYIGIDKNINFYAQWAPKIYKLTVQKTGTGTVTSSSPVANGIACGPDCTEDYDAEVSVILVASTGTIDTWDGCDTVSADKKRCTVKMNAIKTVTANFTGPVPGSRAGCFADSNTSKDLTNYLGDVSGVPSYGLLKRVSDGPSKMGYMLTDPDRDSQTKTFRTKLAGNINKYITSRYCPTTNVSEFWEADYEKTAIIEKLFSPDSCGAGATTNNPSGYFYYKLSGGILTVAPIDSNQPAVTIEKPTVLYVEGADVYIKKDIQYNGDTASLVIIAQKKDNQGGNIYVDPAVTHIDGTLIADGALMNFDGGERINWIKHPNRLGNRLIINGRLLTYNLRGGSLDISLNPLGNGEALGSDGKCADGSKTPISCTSAYAAAQDLERFRWIEPDGDNTCSLYVTNNLPTRRPDILTTVLD